mmetsp:Transcript_26390/g.73768  ORF Transcript_26390/g.73768 Transcript_26390/m.73768 type:complete len:215 (-) Transcript_26390:764-1408(-)
MVSIGVRLLHKPRDHILDHLPDLDKWVSGRLLRQELELTVLQLLAPQSEELPQAAADAFIIDRGGVLVSELEKHCRPSGRRGCQGLGLCEVQVLSAISLYCFRRKDFDGLVQRHDFLRPQSLLLGERLRLLATFRFGVRQGLLVFCLQGVCRGQLICRSGGPLQFLLSQYRLRGNVLVRLLCGRGQILCDHTVRVPGPHLLLFALRLLRDEVAP